MSRTLTIRNIPEPVFERFADVARKSHRNAEAHGRFLVERESAQLPLETCGEILDGYSELPPPKVEEATIEAFQASRGRRSHRA